MTLPRLLTALTTSLLLSSALSGNSGDDRLSWGELPSLPDPFGFAAPYAGVAGGALVVAGGANFPAGRPWHGARKLWHDRIFLLAQPDGVWRLAGTLPRPLGYGIALTVTAGVLCIGGSDERAHHADVFLLRRAGGRIAVEPYPNLPFPLAHAAGALVGDTAYVFGGQTAPPARPTAQLWALDLAAAGAAAAGGGLPPLPGRPRFLAMAGAYQGALYVFGGVDLVPASGETLRREYLREAWSFHPERGWKRLADLPAPRAAAPTPVPEHRQRLLILGGDDGSLAEQVATLKDRHPGFSREIWAYDPASDRWAPAGLLPSAPGPDPAHQPQAGVWPAVTTSAVTWHQRVVVPSGEIRPGVRSPRVLAADLPRER